MINSAMTVREVVVQLPEATRLFETLKIDYCCGGNQPLTKACESAGVEVDNIMSMLAGLSDAGTNDKSVDFQTFSPTKLIDHIVETHHVFTRTELDRMSVLVEKVYGVHGANHPELLKVRDLFQRLDADLRPHMFKEEQVLFPYITRLEAAVSHNQLAPFAPFGTVNNPIRMMMMEHDMAGTLLRELRAVTSDYKTPPDACISYQTLYQAFENFEKDLHQHIHLENNILFPKAIELEAD
ncbi:MAG TPA: iron-sulfur cluster repair di-iron protein [Pyrinomonadaceae bacterium]|nr:iron-sulfur cluster repair di-iron protein [Pyrinomonadaceae bacterium]